MFKVGDKVVIESYRNTYISCGRLSQYSIGDLMVIRNLEGNVISDDDYNFIDYRDVRHATPQEITVGHRIDCEIIDYPEDYTSPNCKKYDERVE